MLKVWATDDNSTGLFQGDIAGVDPETIRAGDTFVSSDYSPNSRRRWRQSE